MNQQDRVPTQQKNKKQSGVNVQLPAYYENPTNSALNNGQHTNIPPISFQPHPHPNPYQYPNNLHHNPNPSSTLPSNPYPPMHYNYNGEPIQYQYPPPPPQFIIDDTIKLSKAKLFGFLLIYVFALFIFGMFRVTCNQMVCTSSNQSSCYQRGNCQTYTVLLTLHLITGLGYLLLNIIICCIGPQKLDCYHIFLYMREDNNVCRGYQCWQGVLLGILYQINFFISLFYFIYFVCVTCKDRPALNQVHVHQSADNMNKQ